MSVLAGERGDDCQPDDEHCGRWNCCDSHGGPSNLSRSNRRAAELAAVSDDRSQASDNRIGL